MLINNVKPYTHYYATLRESRRKFILALLECYLDKSVITQINISQNFLKKFHQYIIEANNGHIELKPDDFIYQKIIQTQHPDALIKINKIKSTFDEHMAISKKNAKNIALNDRRNLVIVPVVAAIIPLFLIAIGIAMCVLQQVTISAIIFFLVLGCASLLGSQGYLWGVAKGQSVSRREKMSALSTTIKEDLFDQDTFNGTVFEQQILKNVLQREHSITTLLPQPTTQPNRYRLWFLSSSAGHPKNDSGFQPPIINLT